MWPRMSLKFWSCCHHLLSPGTAYLCHKLWFMRCLRLSPVLVHAQWVLYQRGCTTVSRTIHYIQIIYCFSPCYSSVSYKAGWLSHRGLQVLQRSKSESDSLRLYDELSRRGTLLSMTHLREEFCFLRSTSARKASGGSQGELLASDSLTAKYLTR